MLPFATTKITVTRDVEPTDTDGYDPTTATPQTVAVDVRAVIGVPRGASSFSGGIRDVFTASLHCDPCDLQEEDTITDANGVQWVLLWAARVTGLGQDYMDGQMRQVVGSAP